MKTNRLYTNLTVLIVALFVFSLSSAIILASYTNINIGGLQTGEDGGLVLPTDKDYPDDCTSLLTINGLIVCINSERTPIIEAVYNQEDRWYDGTADASYTGQNLDYPFLYGPYNERKCAYIDCYEDLDLFPQPNGGVNTIICSDTDPPWPKGCLAKSKSPYDHQNLPWPAQEPTLVMNIQGYENNVLFYRYEGKEWPNDPGYGNSGETKCRMFYQIEHLKEPTQSEEGGEVGKDISDAYWSYYDTDFVPEDVFSYVVDWDTEQHDCELIGGDWLSDGEADVADASKYATGSQSWRCCGDDWIWLYNRPIGYKVPSSSGIALAERENSDTDPLCMYSKPHDDDNYGTAKRIGDSIDFSEGYRCNEPPHEQYDPVLSIDVGIEKEGRISADPDFPYYFVGTGDSETDIGKWADADDGQAAFCDHYFSNVDGEGEMFRWMTISDAANLDQMHCEVYLGYNWTGSSCCGLADEETYNDEETECDALPRAYELTNSGIELSSPDFEWRFEQRCSELDVLNRACFEGNAIENRSSTSSESTPETRDVYNENGILYFCNRLEGPQVYTDFEHKSKCTIMGSGHNDFSVCAYKNDSWFDYQKSSFLGFYASHKGEKTREYLLETTRESLLPPAAQAILGNSIQDRECCMLNSCWNGTTCVDEFDVYKIQDNKWSPFSLTADANNANPNRKIYRCYQGVWQETEEKFNWFYDPTKLNVCVLNHSCYCSGTPTTGPDFYCGEDNVEMDCTIKENFFIDDHYCEAEYNNAGTVIGSRWTSRTKMLFEQMEKIAAGSSYTIFCDTFENSINYYDELTPLADSINSFCVLNNSMGTLLGVSLNIDEESGNSMNEVLFSSNNGLVRLLDEPEIASCSNAINNAEANGHGSFLRCRTGNDKLWLNNKTQTIIYAKDGITISSEPAYSQNNARFDSIMSEFKGFIDSNSDSIIIPGLSNIGHATDLNTVYSLKTSDGKTVFGLIENRYDSDAKDLRYILAVKYHGFNIDCDEVEGANSGLVCGKISSGDTYIFAKSQTKDFSMWNDLTAKLRIG